MRHLGSKNKAARREGMDLGLKTAGSKSQASLLKRINVLPGQHGARGRRKVSERGRQLREKQKLRFIFGITEKQLKSYFGRASKKTGNTALFLSQFLEKRLDNVVYRVGFAPTRAAARQLVGHGHIKVNGKKVTIPSFQVMPGDKITFAGEKSAKIPYVEAYASTKDMLFPAWIDRKPEQGSLTVDPTQEEIEKQVDLRSVIEYYSR